MTELHREGTLFDASTEQDKTVQIDLHAKSGDWIQDWAEMNRSKSKAARIEAVRQTLVPELSPDDLRGIEVVGYGSGMAILRADALANGIGNTPKVVLFPPTNSQINRTAA